ncbi:MAG: isochorismatase family protein [Acidimicrobiales bacterium]
MSALDTDYDKAGFSRQLGYGKAPVALFVDAVRAYSEPSSPLYLPSAEAALTAMGRLLSQARRHGVPAVFTAVVFDSPEGREAPHFFAKVPSLSVFCQGSALGEMAEQIKPAAGEPVIEKKYASAFFGTTLSSWLAVRRIDTVLICGFSTSGCIRATAVDCLQHGFRPMVVKEAVADRDCAPHDANLFDINAKYGDVVTLEGALGYLETLSEPGSR